MGEPSAHKSLRDRTSTALSVIAFLGLVGMLVWGVWSIFTVLSPQVATALVAGSATILVSVTSVLLSKRSERLHAIEQEHRKQKLPIYKDFMAFWMRILMAEKIGQKAVTEKELLQFMHNFTQQMLVWGSDPVLKEYVVFRTHFAQRADGNGGHPVTAMLEFERLLLAMRADIGHKNNGLAPGDLLRLFINDLDTILDGDHSQTG